MSVVRNLVKLLCRNWARVLGVTLLALPAIGFVVLEVLRLIGFHRGVESVSLPEGSEIGARAREADYVDAYRAPIPVPVSLDLIEQFAFQRGLEVASTRNELVFAGGAPGLRFLVSYYLTEPGPDQTVTVSTAVFYESALGALYFAPVQQIHKRGVPFIISHVVKASP